MTPAPDGPPRPRGSTLYRVGALVSAVVVVAGTARYADTPLGVAALVVAVLASALLLFDAFRRSTASGDAE